MNDNFSTVGGSNRPGLPRIVPYDVIPGFYQSRETREVVPPQAQNALEIRDFMTATVESKWPDSRISMPQKLENPIGCYKFSVQGPDNPDTVRILLEKQFGRDYFYSFEGNGQGVVDVIMYCDTYGKKMAEIAKDSAMNYDKQYGKRTDKEEKRKKKKKKEKGRGALVIDLSYFGRPLTWCIAAALVFFSIYFVSYLRAFRVFGFGS
jgi:hypothetical protein